MCNIRTSKCRLKKGNKWKTVTVSVAHLFVRHFCTSKSCLATVTLSHGSRTCPLDMPNDADCPHTSLCLSLLEMRCMNIATPVLRSKQTQPIYLTCSTTFAEKQPSGEYLHNRAVATMWQASIISVKYTRRVTAD